MPTMVKGNRTYVSNAFIIHKKLSVLSISVLSWISLASCQVVGELDVIASDNNIYFKSGEVESGIRRGNSYLLLDLTVIRQDCKNDCKAWQLVRKNSAEHLTPHQDNLFQGHLAYGENHPNMEERTRPKQLIPGEYKVSSTIEVFDSEGDPTKSLLLYRKFIVEKDETKGLSIEYID